MPYDDNEKLMDQVGMLVGLLNSDDDRILKLAKVQLIQLEKKTLPILKVVLDDMRMKESEDQKKMDEFEQNQREEESEGYGIRASASVARRDDIENEAIFSPSIVKGVLDVLSFYGDDTLIQTFSDWLPWESAIDGLIKIGSENAFRAVTPSLSDLFSLGYLDSQSAYEIRNLIKSYEKDSGYNIYDSPRTSAEKMYTLVKNKIIKEIADFVDKDVITRFVNSYPNLSPALKDLVAALIIIDKDKNYSDKVLKWAENGSDEDVKRLSVIIMDLRPEINSESSKRLFSKSISNYKETENLLQYLMSNAEVDDLVEMELELYIKSEENRRREKMPGYLAGSNRTQEPPEPEVISKYIISKLQDKREDAISYISKVLTDKNKNKVKAASWLLNQIT